MPMRPRFDNVALCDAKPECEQRTDKQGRADADDGRRPAEMIEHHSEHDAAGKPAGVVGGKIDAARGPALGAGRTADEAGGCCLREEGSKRHEDEADEHRCERVCQEEWKADRRNGEGSDDRRPRADPAGGFSGKRVARIDGTNTK